MCSDGSATAAQYRTDENDARNWQSTTGKANAATPDTANAPPCQPYNPYKPPDARNEHTREKMPPQRPSQRHRRATRHDEQDDVHATTLPAYRYDDETPLPACRYDRQNVQNAATNTAARSTTRRHGAHSETSRRRDEWRDENKTSRPAKWERLEKRNDHDTTATRHRKRKQNHPASEENQATENDSTHTAPASSQSPPGYHQSTKS